jgi:hypothetical protein
MDVVVWKVCVDQESGMSEGPGSGTEEETNTYV